MPRQQAGNDIKCLKQFIPISSRHVIRSNPGISWYYKRWSTRLQQYEHEVWFHKFQRVAGIKQQLSTGVEQALANAMLSFLSEVVLRTDVPGGFENRGWKHTEILADLAHVHICC